jgi:hypothetical protein
VSGVIVDEACGLRGGAGEMLVSKYIMFYLHNFSEVRPSDV